MLFFLLYWYLLYNKLSLTGDFTMSRIVRVLAIDPALSACGWALLDLVAAEKGKTPEIQVTSFGCIKSIGTAKRVAYSVEVEKYGTTIVSLALLRDRLGEIIETYKPDYVAIEDAFYNRFRPNAYASLVQCISVIQLLCRDKFDIESFKIPTRTAKQTLVGNGNASKEDVMKAVLNSKHIKFKKTKKNDTTDMVLHESDAIAVGNHFILQIFPSRKIYK